LVDEHLPVLFIATKDAYYEKIISNIQEIKARKGQVIAVVSEDDTLIRSMADHVMEVPEVDELLAPMLSVIPTQLLSYYIGVELGLDVDKPRNLAKSVTVE
jgi:glucosamine--fructose-6-phosphate aminotransferase (isomerizing)